MPVWFRPALVLLTLAGFALRLHGLHRQSFWPDEVDALAFAAEPVGTLLRKLWTIGENGPLYFVLEGLAGPGGDERVRGPLLRR